MTIIYKNIYFPAIATNINNEIVLFISNRIKGTATEKLILSRVSQDCKKEREEQIHFIDIERTPPE